MGNKLTLSNELFFSRTSDFLEVFLVKQCNKSCQTKESYRDALTVFMRYAESRGKSILTFKFTDCSYEFLLDYKEYLADKKSYSPASINQRLAAIKSYMKYCAGCDPALAQIYISVSAVPFSTVPKKQLNTLGEESVSALLHAPSDNKRGLRDTLIMSLLFDTAIRLDELIQLKAGDIYQNKEMTFFLIHGKGNKERKVSLDKKTADLLDVYMSRFHSELNPETPLIYTVIKGCKKQMSHRNVQKMLKKYAEKVSAENSELQSSIHPHLLRRSRATNLYQNGVPIEIVSRFLGHSSLETTKQHYAFPSLEQMRSAMEAGADIPESEEALWKGHEDELAKLCGLR